MGVAGPIRKTSNSTWTAALTEDDGDHTSYVNGMRIFAFFTIMLGPILFMNTFITVLGNAYDDCKENINERFVNYRTNSLKILMLRRLFFQNMGFNFLCQHRNYSNDQEKGVWIRLPEYCLVKPTADDAATSEQIQFLQADLNGKIKELRDLVLLVPNHPGAVPSHPGAE